MQLGITVDMSGPHPKLDLERILEAERLGFTQAWVGEAYSTDAVSPVAWILARTSRLKAGTGIMQMSARTPACAAMTVLALQALSGNRFLCGVGPSGPQVVEGWHGLPFGKPMQRTKEYIAIIKQILAREKPLEFHGEFYDIPYAGPDASGLGKPLRSIAHGNPDVPFYTASITPAGLRMAGEVADGTLPIFLFAGAARHRHRADSGRTQEGRPRYQHGRLRRRPLCPRQDGSRRSGVPRCDPAGAGAVYRRDGRSIEELLQRCRGQARLRRRGKDHPGPVSSMARRPRPPPRFLTSWWMRFHLVGRPNGSRIGSPSGRMPRRPGMSAPWC